MNNRIRGRPRIPPQQGRLGWMASGRTSIKAKEKKYQRGQGRPLRARKPWTICRPRRCSTAHRTGSAATKLSRACCDAKAEDVHSGTVSTGPAEALAFGSCADRRVQGTSVPVRTPPVATFSRALGPDNQETKDRLLPAEPHPQTGQAAIRSHSDFHAVGIRGIGLWKYGLLGWLIPNALTWGGKPSSRLCQRARRFMFDSSQLRRKANGAACPASFA